MPPYDIDELRRKLTHAEAVIAELRGVVAELRRQVEAQQAHIHHLVKMTFGRSSERVEGPTLFDGLDPKPGPTPAVVVAPVPEPVPRPKRKGHGRRRKPQELPRRREQIDLSEPEKVCTCCGTAKVRIGQCVSERRDYQPLAIFVKELVRPVYACRSCESGGLEPWAYLTHVLTELPRRAAGADLGDRLPDEWAKSRSVKRPRVG